MNQGYVSAQSFQVWEDTRRGFGISRFGLLLAGKAWNRLLVLEDLGQVNGEHKVRCLCQCGQETVTFYYAIKGGNTTSCGCWRREVAAALFTTHGASNPGSPDFPLFRTWVKMHDRCYNPRTHNYRFYGARGITICEEWRKSFAAFRDWARANGYQHHLTIDRIDNDGSYEPENCRFVTWTQQQRNRRGNHLVTAFGETKCISAWAEDPRCRVYYKALSARLSRGWSPEQAISTAPKAKVA